jgi:hypothetical protein
MPTIDEGRRRTSARPITMACTVDGRDHLVSDQATTAGLLAGRGHYIALCGRVVVAESLVTPPRPSCLNCETALHRVSTNHPAPFRRRRDAVMWPWRRRIRSRFAASWVSPGAMA